MAEEYFNYLSNFRKVNGFTQNQLGILTQVPKSTISNYETGSSPSLDHAYRLSTVLQTTVEEIWPNPYEVGTVTQTFLGVKRKGEECNIEIEGTF